MAYVFRRVTCYPNSPGLTLVEWDLHRLYAGLPPYVFTVETSRSGDPSGTDWITVGTSTGNTVCAGCCHFNLSDTIQREFGPAETWFYRVKLADGSGGHYTSDPEPAWGSCNRQDYLRAREITRQAYLGLSKFSGTAGILYKRRHWGPLCGVAGCLNPDTQEVTDPNCRTCYGTRFTGGYFAPVPYYVKIEGGGFKSHSRQEETGTTDEQSRQAMALAVPLPRPFDVWIDTARDKRFIIQEVKAVESLRETPITLVFEMRLAPPTDIIYQLPLA